MHLHLHRLYSVSHSPVLSCICNLCVVVCLCIGECIYFSWCVQFKWNWKPVQSESVQMKKKTSHPYAIFLFSLSLFFHPNVVFAEKKVGMRWFFRFCISKWFWGFHLTQQQKQRQRSPPNRMTTREKKKRMNERKKSAHKSSIVQISMNHRFLWIILQHFSEVREKKKYREPLLMIFRRLDSNKNQESERDTNTPREKKNANAHSNGMAFGWLKHFIWFRWTKY